MFVSLYNVILLHYFILCYCTVTIITECRLHTVATDIVLSCDFDYFFLYLALIPAVKSRNCWSFLGIFCTFGSVKGFALGELNGVLSCRTPLPKPVNIDSLPLFMVVLLPVVFKFKNVEFIGYARFGIVMLLAVMNVLFELLDELVSEVFDPRCLDKY